MVSGREYVPGASCALHGRATQPIITTALGWHVEDLTGFEFRFVLRLRPFSLKRGKQVVKFGDRASIGLSSEAKAWLRDAAAQLAQQWRPVFGAQAIPKDVELNAAIVSYLPTKALPDASNLYEGPQDALKRCTRWCKPKCDRHAGVLVDDVSIRTHDGCDRLVDQDNPRVEIVLTPCARAAVVAEPRQKELAL